MLKAVSTPLRLASTKLATSQKPLHAELGKIGPIRFPAKGPLRVEVDLEDPRRLALEVTAFEEVANADD